jgi:hypothetical protein
MSPKREEAAKILERIPKTAEGIRSDTQGELFKQWTGITHDEMKKSWRENMKGPKLYTACGGFAGTFGVMIGIKGIKSYFDLKESLTEAGKAHAWVPASSGADPQVGDILRHTVFHVDVAAGWDGRKLKRVAAGQSLHPRPTTNVENEFDALKWVTGGAAYNPANLQGWLDLDKYFGTAPAAGPTFGWLNGWWKVWDGTDYWYHFASDGVVKYVTTQPDDLDGPPGRPENVGTFSYTPPSTLVVTWRRVASASAACRETFYNAVPGCEKMNARSNLYSPLVATRLGESGRRRSSLQEPVA